MLNIKKEYYPIHNKEMSHPDNGSEFINYHLLRFIKKHGIMVPKVKTVL